MGDDADLSGKRWKKRLWGGLFVGAVGCISASAGFGYGLRSKKFGEKQLEKAIHAESVLLAARALARGTVYAICGVGLLSFLAWKALGVHSAEEFREKMEKFFKSKVPDIPRNSPAGRGDFKSFREFFEYLDEESKKDKRSAVEKDS